MFTIKRGPVLLWSVTTVVQRTNERIAGITGSNPVVINDYYRVAMFEIKMITNINLNLTELRIFGSMTGSAASTTVGFPPLGTIAAALTAPIQAGVPLLLANGHALTVSASLPINNAIANSPGLVVPPALCLEYSTAAPGATPNLVFEIRAVFFGNPVYVIEP